MFITVNGSELLGVGQTIKFNKSLFFKFAFLLKRLAKYGELNSYNELNKAEENGTQQNKEDISHLLSFPSYYTSNIISKAPLWLI